VEVKMLTALNDASQQERLEGMKRMERKIGFLSMELQDIKNNKGTMTLQVKSVEHLQTWLKKSSHFNQSEMLIQPVDISTEVIENSFVRDVWTLGRGKWWESGGQDVA
jgi:hypothetical protein